ncbi:MAG: PIN domain-containing protein [Nitrososphaerota archaeon]|nr:PIN domain-containing protein [Nitrososphaerota archaeon]MDG6939765.1 PIN domain-containing protein [Nitrososphaerota archaeon]
MLFETRYFWAVFTSRNAGTTGKLRALFEKSKSAYASSITVYEVYKQTLANEDKAVAALRAATIRREFDIIDVDAQVAEEGADISHRLGVPMADSLIMATAKRYNLPCVTDDPHFSEVKRVWV